MGIVALAIALTLPAPAFGQAVLDGSIGPSAGLVPGGVDEQGQSATYLIQDSFGEQAGGNLFHSFSQFDIGAGETATFAATQPLDNVLARVTGRSASQISGTLRSTIPGADLFAVAGIPEVDRAAMRAGSQESPVR